MLKKSIVDLRKKVRKINSLNDWRMKFNSWTSCYQKNNQKPIFICTSARSGSTWLMQMIAAAEGLRYVDQPLDIRNHHTKKYDLESSWKFLYNSNTNEEALREYIQDLIEGKITLQFPHQFWLDGYDIVSNRLVFKILFGLPLLDWLKKNFNAHLIYLIRHPIPTALSRYKYDWPMSYVNQLIQNNENLDIFTKSIKSFSQRILKNGSELEKYTLQWCVENYFPLKHIDEQDWLKITYEELVLNTEKLVELMIKELDLKQNDYDRMTQMVTKKAKSPMTHEKTEEFLKTASKEDDRSYLIKKWEDEVTEKQEDDIFDILEKFELNIYEKGKFLPTSEHLHFL